MVDVESPVAFGTTALKQVVFREMNERHFLVVEKTGEAQAHAEQADPRHV